MFNEMVRKGTRCLIVLIVLCGIGLARPPIRLDINAPLDSQEFGEFFSVLPNGNIVVVDRTWPWNDPLDSGAVYLYDGSTGAQISRLTGVRRDDGVGISITILTNGNFVAHFPSWDSANAADVGAVILCSGITGCNGQITAQNSLTGTSTTDTVGQSSSTALTNGDYVVRSPSWDNAGIADVGAVTYCSGTAGCVGTVSTANSLFGANAGDKLGISEGGSVEATTGVIPLTNGNYVVVNWKADGERGAVSFGNSVTGTIGVVSPSNSLMGANAGDRVGFSNSNYFGVKALSNGNYAVSSSNWNGMRGAGTLCSGTTGCVGTISAANSIVGTNVNDLVSNIPPFPLPNGNFIISSPSWNGNRGAATFCDGNVGCAGNLSSSNSLVGSNAGQRVSYPGIVTLTNGHYLIGSESAVTWGNGTSGITGELSTDNSFFSFGGGNDPLAANFAVPLANGNYAIRTPTWQGGRGAVTFCNGAGPTTGTASEANSLTGPTNGDNTGYNVIALTNGNYAVTSPTWDNGALGNAGAATFCNASGSCNGTSVTVNNSLVGTRMNDLVGAGNSRALTNGNYVITSKSWNSSRGAVTWINGTTGLVGEVSPANSLVGGAANNEVGGEGVVALLNGNYVVNSTSWDNIGASNAGAITLGNGATGTVGEVSAANSLVGTQTSDFVGFDSSFQGSGGGVRALPNGGYLVKHTLWDNGQEANAGAVTLGRASVPLTGPITDENSVRSIWGGAASQNIKYIYDPLNQRLVVGKRTEKKITTFRYNDVSIPFDFEGDGKTDLSIFRPNGAASEWWWLKSSTGGNAALQFGASTDVPAPVDYTGDGKTDVAFWRPTTGQWFVLRSEDFSFYAFPFGATGDVPAPADYDGDGKADAAVFRESAATWYINRSSGGTDIVGFGAAGDKPVNADYDGDGKSDIAIFRPNGTNGAEWWIRRSSNASVYALQFGNSTDKAVPGDFTGDGKADVAFWRPSTGFWNVLRSEDYSYYAFPFGANGDIASPGDYDGDGKLDAAVFRPSSATWFANRSTAGTLIQQFGAVGDVPVPSAFVR